MNDDSAPVDVAVIGAGIAGATCARALTLAGLTVHIFDKSRGPGGRLATRRLEWVDAQAQARTARLDHGAVGFSARSSRFKTFVDHAVQAGWLAEWMPALAPGSLPIEDGALLYLPVPDMPALCHRLLEGASASWSSPIERVHRGLQGWQLEAGGQRLDAHFQAVVLALPPAQVAPLLAPHRDDWARYASMVTMQPCWTLLGVAQEPELGPQATLRWDVARPPTGTLAWVIRNDKRPGRDHVPGQAQWVVHARTGWSRRHLEQPATWVQGQMQAALAECLGRPVVWHHSAVHRWRYALPQVQAAAPAGQCWWNAAQGLGVCGDFLGGSGVEGAWLSAQSLAAALLQSAGGPVDGPPIRSTSSDLGARGRLFH